MTRAASVRDVVALGLVGLLGLWVPFLFPSPLASAVGYPVAIVAIVAITVLSMVDAFGHVVREGADALEESYGPPKPDPEPWEQG